MRPTQEFRITPTMGALQAARFAERADQGSVVRVYAELRTPAERSIRARTLKQIEDGEIVLSEREARLYLLSCSVAGLRRAARTDPSQYRVAQLMIESWRNGRAIGGSQ